MAAVLAERTSVGAWSSVRCLGARRYVCEAALITFVTLTFGKEAASGYMCIAAAVTLRATVLLGELEAELLFSAIEYVPVRTAVGATSGS